MPDGICPFADKVLDQATLRGWSEGYVDRVGFCDHTAGGYLSTMERESFWNDPSDAVSKGRRPTPLTVHFAIGRRGRIAQVLNIFDTAFAQGADSNGNPVGQYSPGVSWPPFEAMGFRSPNGYLLSTEHEDIENGVYVPRAAWTEEQYQADLAVKRWCVQEVKRVTGKNLLRFGINSLAGHHMFDPRNRANCPGQSWRQEYQHRLYTDLIEGDDDMLHRLPMNIANPAYWQDRAFVAGQESGVDIRSDFAPAGLPLSTREVELEVFLKAGSIDVFDGGTADGLAGYVSAGHSHFRVKLDANGHAWFRALGGGAVIDFIRCLGYYE